MTAIEWTRHRCPCYDVGHGSNSTRGGQDRRPTDRRKSQGIQAKGQRWREVVSSMPEVASQRRVRSRSRSIRRARCRLPEGTQLTITKETPAKYQPQECWQEACSSPGRRPKAGTGKGQLLRRGRLAPEAERSPLRGLLACLGSWRTAARVRPPPWLCRRKPRERRGGVLKMSFGTNKEAAW